MAGRRCSDVSTAFLLTTMSTQPQATNHAHRPQEIWYHKDYGRVKVIRPDRIYRRHKQDTHYRVTFWPVIKTAPSGARLKPEDSQFLCERSTLKRAPWPSTGR